MKTFEQLWEAYPLILKKVDKNTAHAFFRLGQNTPKPNICDKMLMGIEQDRIRRERTKR